MSEPGTKEEFYRQLRAEPLVDMIGVVDASGSGGGMSPGDALWSLTFSLAARRIRGRAVNKVELIVRRPATKRQLKSYMDRIKANTVVRLRARVAMENVWHRPEALLEKFLGEDNSDAELNECLSELLKPVVHTDEFYGDLTLDRSVTSYDGRSTWNGIPVELRLGLLDSPDGLLDAIQCARDFWANSVAWNQRILDCIARDLLPLKSENWREDDGSDVSREEFESRMKLQSITIRPDGDFEVWYDDDNLFFGHDIAVMGKLGSDKLSAGIHG